jgi:pimeloyl-ACP methyl ester carboxylesterase
MCHNLLMTFTQRPQTDYLAGNLRRDYSLFSKSSQGTPVFYDPFLYRSQAGYEALQTWYDSAVKRLSVPVESRYVPTRFGTTHTLIAGPESAPPLVLVPGYGAGAPLWKGQLEGLSDRFRLYAPDAVGQPGRSATTRPDLLSDGYVDWLQDVFDGLHLARPAVAGVCLGGWIALRLAALRPERVERLIMLSPVGVAPFKVYVRSGIPLVLNMRKSPDAAGLRLLRMIFAPPGAGISFNREVFHALSLVVKHYNAGALVGMSTAPKAREVLSGLRALIRFVRAEPPAVLRRIRTPSLLVVGAYEAIFDPKVAVRRATRHMPDIRAEIVADTGHAAMYDKPEYVNDRILRFLTTGK